MFEHTYSQLPSVPRETKETTISRRQEPIYFVGNCAKGAFFATIFVCCNLLCLGAFLMGRYSVSLDYCGRRLSAWSPALEAIHYEEVMYSGDFHAPSIYRGYPSSEIDAAWERITTDAAGIGSIRISKEDLPRLNKSATQDILGFPGEQEWETHDAQTFLEVFHQLHCLNMLRQRTWPEHYNLSASANIERTHIDHCIEMLRINIMCHADVTPITATWNATGLYASPDFSTRHICRNFERVRDWSISHSEPVGRVSYP